MFKRSGHGICACRGISLRSTSSSQARHASNAQQGLKSNAPDTGNPPETANIFSREELEDQLELENAADTLRRVFLGPEAVHRARNVNERLYRWQFQKLNKLARRGNTLQQEHGQESKTTKPAYYLAELNTEDESKKIGHQLLRAQLHACVSPEDFTRVFTAAFRSERWTELLANPRMQRTICTNLDERLKPHRVLGCLALYIQRLQNAGQRLDDETIWAALLSAARAHSTTSIRHFLKVWFDRTTAERRKMPLEKSVELVKAISYGYRRAKSGREALASERALTEIFFGFSDSPFAGRYHLQIHLPLFHPDVISHWDSLISEYQAGDYIKKAWDLYRFPEGKQGSAELDRPSEVVGGIITAFCHTGHPRRAWEVFKTHGQLLSDANQSAWHLLFTNMDTKPDLEPDLQEQVRINFANKLEQEITKLERAMNLKWMPSAVPDAAAGHHVPLFADFDHTLLKLSDAAQANKIEQFAEQREQKKRLAEQIGIPTEDGHRLVPIRSFQNIPYRDARQRAQRRELFRHVKDDEWVNGKSVNKTFSPRKGS